MKKFSSFIFLLILTGLCFAQPILNRETTLTPFATQIVKINTSSYDYGTYAIGRETVGSDVKIYRTYFEFSLSEIPTTATIQQVTVNYSTGNIGSYTLKFTQVATVSTDKGANWAAIGNGSSLHTGVAYNGSSFNSTPIKTAIQNSLSGGKLIIGALSENENTNGSWSSMTLDLYVTYTYPAALLSLQARNDLNGGNGGNVGVGIYPNAATSYPSIYPFQTYESYRLNLAAYDNQTVNGKVWFFNDTEYSIDKSDWKKYKTSSGYSPLSDAASFTTAQLQVNDNNSDFIAYLKTTSYTTNGALSSNETWFTNVTLTGDVTVPTGKTLTITSDATVNLFNGGNRFSIISTGGTITNNGTIVDLRAQLQANTVLKGLCGTIQTAATHANNGNEIVLADGNFNENVSISNKSDLTITGGSANNTHFGTLTLTNCDYFYGYNFGTKSVYLNQADYAMINNIDAYGTNQSTIGFYLYNSDAAANNILADYSQVGVSCYDGSEADIDDSWLYNNLRGIDSYNSSNVNVENTYFCGTALDLKTYNSSSIYATSCYFDGGTPSVSGSNIYHYGNQNCSSYKISPNRQTENKDYVIVTNEDKPGGSEFDRINSAYFTLNRKLSNALKEKTDISKETFSIDYEKVIEDFKKFISNNPDSPLANIALIASAKSYRRIDDLRGKNDFAGMKIFLTDIIENKEYSSLKPQAERLMIDYYRLTGNFKAAIETADKLIENHKESSDYVCGVLYAKGLIFAHDLNEPDKAAQSFSYILRQYPENGLAALAENELRILGQEVGEQISVEAEIVGNKIESNNYPNPFNPSTTISYSLPEAGNVQIKIYDVLGREIAKLVDETKGAGKHTVAWNGSNNASGIYFYTITFNNQTLYKKMLMLK